MTIADFKRQLAKTEFGPGAAWLKADFHIHEPGSSDYEFNEANAALELVRAIRDGGYRFVVVLKHQEFPSRQELDALQKHCPDTLLVAGAEINVFVDALFKKIGKDYFFHCIVAVDPKSATPFDYILHKAKENFLYKPSAYPAGFHSNIVELGKFFREQGALFIPAHLHQSKSPDKSRSIDDLYDDDAFLGFIRDGAFDALEVRQLSTAAYFTGNEKTNIGQEIPGIVCVASSDAHHHKHIVERKRATWVRAEQPTFQELKAALNFRHRTRLEKPKIEHARIIGLHVKGAFISEIWMHLNEGLNAIIGSKGAGKTALIECIRFVLNTPIPPEREEAVARHIQHVLGSSGYVECLVGQSDRTELLITRRADAQDRITILDQHGDTRVISTNEEMAFPISILGWHEIEGVADRAEARILLLDQVGSAGEVRSLYESIRKHVDQARDVLPGLQRLVKKLDNLLREMWALQRKRKTLQKLEQSELVALQQQYEWFLSAEQKVGALQTALKDRISQVPDLVPSRITLGLENPPESNRSATLAEAIRELDDKLVSNATDEAATVGSLQGGLETISTAAQKAVNLFSSSFSKFRDEIYTPQVNALPSEDRDILTRQIQVLEETKRLPTIERECSDLLNAVHTSANQIKNSCDSIIDVRKAIVEKRQNLVADLNSELLGVQLNFLPYANQSMRVAFQQRYPNEGASMVGYVQNFGRADSYENLRELFAKLSNLRLEKESWDVKDLLYDAKFVEMFDVIDDDDVQISLNVGKAGYVSIQNLSAGQRCVAVFPLLLRNTKGPLVIDQPEDNLDNRYIADSIGPDLLKQKQGQQFLMTSHNANLVVLTDADLIVHVDSDGAQASISKSGFLASSSSGVRNSVLDVLDGGEAALAARQMKYGTNKVGL